MKYLILFFVVLTLTGCNELKNFKSGSVTVGGGVAGNSSSLVTISGRVMSTATYRTISGQSLSIVSSSVQAMLGSPEPIVQFACGDDPCDYANWTMKYVGSAATVASGSSNCGDFNIPSIPAGKEGVVIFSCTGVTQRCLVKAGDSGLNCNAIADGVVGALESALNTTLDSSSLVGKTIAKVANSIVESTNSDTAEAQNLKASIELCKTIVNSAQKNSCYKDSLESSGQSNTLSVVKTLAQAWTVQNLFNFIVGTAGYKIEIDNMIYTDFGNAFDDWLSTDFVAKTREFVADVVSNPNYVNGDPTKGEQPVKIDCQVYYSKYQSGGATSYKPTIVNVGGVSVPTCNNPAEISALVSLPANDPKVVDFMAAVDAGDFDRFQFGDPRDGTNTYIDYNNDNDNDPTTGVNFNCSNGAPAKGTFCVSRPRLVISAKSREVNRNDMAGTNSTYEYIPNVGLIEIFPAVMTRINQLVAISAGAGSPSPGCITMPGGGHGTPVIDFATPACVTWMKSEFSVLKKEFSGMLGIYNYLKNPAAYATGGSGKLSLTDIHRLFTKNDFLDSMMVTNSFGDYSYKQAAAGGMQPVIDFSGVAPFISDIFSSSNVNINNPMTNAEFNSVLTGGNLLNHYAMTFQLFETIPTTSQIQNSVQGSSHHEAMNPYGSKFSYVLAAKKTVVTDPDIPIFCRMVNKNKTDINGNFLPMLKELNPDSKIECLADPAGYVPAITTTATDGLYDVPANFPYPYVLQPRGFNGDAKGKLFVLADRKTGQPVRIGYDEIYILEARNANMNAPALVVSGTCSAAVNDGVVKAKVYYGQGSDARNEVVTAYCLNMSALMQSDNDTRIYYGGDVEITQNNNGAVNSFKFPLVGGFVTTETGFNIRPVCLFASHDYFTLNAGKYQLLGSYAPNMDNSTYTDTYSNTYQKIKLDPANLDIVDFCDQTHSGKTKLNLTQFFDNTIHDVTNAADRNSKPMGLYNPMDKTNYWGVLITLDQIEPNKTNLQIANTAGVTYNFQAKLLNQKHDAKFDPFCDDVNENGRCDCDDSNGNPVTTRACYLTDNASEPTISNPPYQPGPNAANFIAFFNAYGGKSGNDLMDGGTPLSQAYFNANQIYMDFQEIVVCKYLANAETTRRHPTSFNFNDFTANFDGCPLNANAAPTQGPIRIIKPVAMNNAFDIVRPKTFMTMVQYATKSVGQGISVSPTDKIFSFDEAIALIAARNMLPPKLNAIHQHSDAGPLYNANGLQFQPIRVSQNTDMSVVSAILKAITKPDILNAP